MGFEFLSGYCLKCNTPTTNHADGRARPLCADCERELLKSVEESKTGKHIKKKGKAKLFFPPDPEDDRSVEINL